MLNKLEVLAKRVGGNNEIIDWWLQARKQLLVSYCALLGTKPNKKEVPLFDDQALDLFCHQLVDYLSLCHFTLYEKILLQAEDNQTPQHSTDQLYAALQENTQQIMTYYDQQFEEAVADMSLHPLELQQVLSNIGEVLAERFSLEDQLIQWAARAISNAKSPLYPA